MSSVNFTNFVILGNVNMVTCGVTIRTVENEDLGSFILRVYREKGIDGQHVENAARRAGYKLDRSSISRLISGASGNPTLDTLKALAAGLGVSVCDVFKAACNLGVERNITREISLPEFVWSTLDQDSLKCNRSYEDHLRSILLSYYNLRDVGHAPFDRALQAPDTPISPPLKDYDTKPVSTEKLAEKGVTREQLAEIEKERNKNQRNKSSKKR